MQNTVSILTETWRFVISVGEFSSFRPVWHQDDRPGPLVRQYQLTLDAILRVHSDLDFALAAPGVRRHRFTRQLFALCCQLTNEMFRKTVFIGAAQRRGLGSLRRAHGLCC